MPAILAQGLSRRFGERVAVDALSFEVAPGEIFGLVGPDGAGKTTTMRLLTGILTPTAGGATVDGCDVVRDAEGLKHRIGYMSQRFGLYPDLTVAENIAFYADIFGVPTKERAARTERLLAFSNLTPFRRRLAGNLSGGMKQKLGLACALIHTPRVLFLDEPTNGVDPVSRRDFWRILYQLVREGVTLFVSTAYLDEAERCNRLALLHEGRLLGIGTPDEVRSLMPSSVANRLRSAPDEAVAPAVEVRDLHKHFGGFKAVAGVSFSVRRGEIFGFLGPNGAGKSTTIRMLCGLLSPTSGSGSVDGLDIVRDTELIRTRIGYMSQKFSLYDELTVEENIDFYSGIYCLPRAKRAERKDWVLGMAGLREQRDRRTSELSGGWKQRLALGCAVLHEPPLLFLDEPTSGVDPAARRQFWDLIYSLARQGVTVLVTTHYMEESEYCDRLGIIYRGELIALGTPTELKTRHMSEAVLDIDCSHANDAMGLIEALPEVQEVALFGRGLHAVATDAAAAERAIRAALLAKGFTLHRVERITPTLEDVFVSLIEARDRSGSTQEEVSR
jgi:ABC-2 type transport system ATP-binding protein